MEKDMKNKKKVVVTAIVLSVLLVACLVFAIGKSGKTMEDETIETTETVVQESEALPAETVPEETVEPMPWEEPGAKQPEEYTWEEYETLTETQQKLFQEFMGSESFGKWLDSMRENYVTNPWNEFGAKQPADYTWEEYEMLSIVQQVAFQKHLGLDAFEAWFHSVQVHLEKNPWEQAGAKQPEDYTWVEFEALTSAQQMAFQYHMGATEFEKWVAKAQEQSGVMPWQASGAKQPEEYTWKEFEALTVAQQMAFQNHLGMEGFENWLNIAQNQDVTNPWERKGAKQPENYSWMEFEALTPAQQMAFQEHLGLEAFDYWLNSVQTQIESNPWDRKGAKQPEKYTWAEFEALTPAQQMAFQNHLGEEAFEVWLNGAQDQIETNPWDVPGAKQPMEYTWEEFDALTPAQQMAFQNFLGYENFEIWLNRETDF